MPASDPPVAPRDPAPSGTPGPKFTGHFTDPPNVIKRAHFESLWPTTPPPTKSPMANALIMMAPPADAGSSSPLPPTISPTLPPMISPTPTPTIAPTPPPTLPPMKSPTPTPTEAPTPPTPALSPMISPTPPPTSLPTPPPTKSPTSTQQKPRHHPQLCRQ